MLRIVLAVLHLLALGIGLGAVYARAGALRAVAAPGGIAAALPRALVADAWWAVAGALWIGTGLWRAIAGTEKAPAYYAHNHVFWGKMAALALLLVLEAWPAVVLTRWRRRGVPALAAAAAAAAGDDHVTAAARGLARASVVQLVLVLVMLVAAVLMARGYGLRP